jgi:hypothetical protein
MAGIGGADIETARAAHQGASWIVGSWNRGYELVELTGFGVDLEDKEVVGLLSHCGVEARLSGSVHTGKQADPVYRPNGNADVLDMRDRFRITKKGFVKEHEIWKVNNPVPV